MYDYLIIGAGLYGAVCARLLTDAGKKVLVVEKRNHIGGNIYTEEVEEITVHKYGAHVFHTNDRQVWEFLQHFAEFDRYIHSPTANYKGEVYSLPFNMYTFNRMWGVVTAEEAEKRIAEQRAGFGKAPANLEEQAISFAGKDIYEKLVKGYTEKQWGRPCDQLPASIIKRLPVRFTYDTRYFDDLYQGIPVGGYTAMVERMLTDIDLKLGTDYLRHKTQLDPLAGQIIYTGPIDAFFDYRLGALEYRSVRFETSVLDIPNYQGNSVVNYTDAETPWTRIIEHKWFTFGKDVFGKETGKTVISKEYPSEWRLGKEPYYPVNNEKNNALHKKYAALAKQDSRVLFGGRLGEYRYYDMDETAAAAMQTVRKILEQR